LTKNQTIKKILAVIMLALFGFSVTPKLILHNLVANHKDTPLKPNSANTEQLSKSGFNCDCDNLVVESPFVDDHSVTEIIIPVLFSLHINKDVNDFNVVSKFYIELRGPPYAV
jgi:hypothetical protein